MEYENFVCTHALAMYSIVLYGCALYAYGGKCGKMFPSNIKANDTGLFRWLKFLPYTQTPFYPHRIEMCMLRVSSNEVHREPAKSLNVYKGKSACICLYCATKVGVGVRVRISI